MGPDDIEPEWEAPLVGRDDVGEGGKDPLGKYTWETRAEFRLENRFLFKTESILGQSRL